MDRISLTVVEELPALTVESDDHAHVLDEILNGTRVMASVYARYADPEGKRAKGEVSVRYARAVQFVDERGRVHSAVGAVVAPAGEVCHALAREVVILLIADGNPSVIVCPAAWAWVARFSEGRLRRDPEYCCPNMYLG